MTLKNILFSITFINLLISCSNSSDSKKQLITDSIDIQNSHVVSYSDSSKQLETKAHHDKIELTKLIQNMYIWLDSSDNRTPDFSVIGNDSLFTGINKELLDQRLNEMRESNLFAPTFIDNYKNIALTIDKELSEGSLIYHKGYYPPYGSEASPWCNCQDTPENIENIEIAILEIDNDIATFYWTIPNKIYWDNFSYVVQTKKIDKVWKISFLEGLDSTKFFGEK